MTTTLDTSIFMFGIGKYNGFVSKARVSACMYLDKIYGDRRQICERVEVSTVR